MMVERESAMRINNLHLTGLLVGQAAEAPKADLPLREAPDRSKLDNSFHTPSAELSQWVSLVARESEIREEVVDRVALRLATDHYLSPECAELTAQAILLAKE